MQRNREQQNGEQHNHTRQQESTPDTTRYRHVETYRVRFGDLDPYRHVNNKAFLGFVEDARVRYLVDVGGCDPDLRDQVGAMVVHVSIDYEKQITAWELVRVRTRCSRVGHKSFTLHHLIYAGTPTERRVATSETVFASVDMATGSSCPNDPDMIARITNYEPEPPAGGPGT